MPVVASASAINQLVILARERRTPSGDVDSRVRLRAKVGRAGAPLAGRSGTSPEMLLEMSDPGNAEVENPIDPDTALRPNLKPEQIERLVHPQKHLEDGDSAVTRAEKFEGHGATDQFEEPPQKRMKLGTGDDLRKDNLQPTKSERQKGVAPIKPESVFYRQKVVSPWLTTCQIPCVSAWQSEG